MQHTKHTQHMQHTHHTQHTQHASHPSHPSLHNASYTFINEHYVALNVVAIQFKVPINAATVATDLNLVYIPSYPLEPSFYLFKVPVSGMNHKGLF